MAESKEETKTDAKTETKKEAVFQKNSLLKARHLHSTEIY